MPFQYPTGGVFSPIEFQVPGLPYLTGSDAFPPNGYVEVPFPRVTSTIKVKNTAPTGSLRVGFAPPAFDTFEYSTIGAGSEYTFSVRCKRLFISGSALTGSFQIVAGLTGISTRELYEVPYNFADEGTLVGEWRADTSPLYTTSARTTLVTTNGDPVGSWSDLRGVNHASQVSTSLCPTYSSSGLVTSRPAVIFDGVDDVLSTVATDMSAATIFVVGRALENFTAANGYPGFILTAPLPNDFSSNGVLMVYNASSANAYLAAPNTGIWQDTYSMTGISNNDVVLTSWRWGVTRSLNTTRRNRIAATIASSTGTYAAPTGTMKLHFAGSYSGNFSKIAISHVVVYSTPLSTEAIGRVESELNRIWGLGL